MSYRQRPQAVVALAWLKDLRSRTKCKHCGRRPIEWHGNHAGKRRNYRPIAMAARGLPIARIAAEVAVCTPLCRRCHMVHDGRIRQNLGAKRQRATCQKCGRVCAVNASGQLYQHREAGGAYHRARLCRQAEAFT